MHSPINPAASGGCCVFLRRPSLGYRPLMSTPDLAGDPAASVVKVVVGKERRVFFVDSFVLDTEPFRILMGSATAGGDRRRRKGVVFVDVDAILFEHMLWLVYSDRASSSAASLLQLNLKEIIEFYSQDN